MTRIITSTLCGLALFALAVPAVGADDALGEALEVFSLRIDETPGDARLLTDYANLLVRANRIDEARAQYRAALAIDEDSLITLYNAGLLELEVGRERAAGRHFRRALDIDHDFARAHYALGTTLANRRRHRRAVRHFSIAFRLDPDLVDADKNPELLFNGLATWASIHSYLSSSLQRSTRLYSDPQPIVGILVPELEDLMEPMTDEPPAVEPKDNGV